MAQVAQACSLEGRAGQLHQGVEQEHSQDIWQKAKISHPRTDPMGHY